MVASKVGNKIVKIDIRQKMATHFLTHTLKFSFYVFDGRYLIF